jgi:anti-sigma regulatory factor (Ser/Thr protein kinase)
MGSGDDEPPDSDEPPDGSDAMVLNLDEHVPPLVQVRRWAAEALSDLTGDELGDVLLVATELVTNAYDHGRCARKLRIWRLVKSCAVRIEVADNSPALPTLGRSTINPARGRGMVIVDKLSKVWGVIPDVIGKTVWAEVPYSAS